MVKRKASRVAKKSNAEADRLEKEAAEKRAMEVEAVRQAGGRVTLTDIFPPDPVHKSMQGPLEVVKISLDDKRIKALKQRIFNR